ncbi:lipase family protein [Chitinophaga ginsengisoli]|uniref:Lipase (Class 3) n=1 Tax=Chitinophaga ginsengisoli TaxID=363837 RepID=A0A2P8GAL5_9BACT|nr:hypothetical protein [Chitinophaga ginsengisoli]PSL30994.1 lipase (class 3) [Chitinophaga ginsengisoli]
MGTTTSNSNQPANAKIAVQLCSVATAPHPVSDIGKLVPGWKIVWNGIPTLDANYAFIAVDTTGNNYALIIRGSVTPGVFSDWDVFANWVLEDMGVVTMANWPYASTPKPLISTGAYLAFGNMMYMQDSLGSGLHIHEYLLKNTVGNGKQLIIAGHSLGGNMANVYTSFYVHTLQQLQKPADNISLITFAAPAAGNSDFANDLDGKLPLANAWHYQSLNDVVPNFPVFYGMYNIVANLYDPSPEASAVPVNFEGLSMTLKEAIQLLAGVFYLYDYQQPQNNYTTFNTEVYPVDDWFKQGGIQHQLFNYANYLGVKLLTQQPVIQAV